MDDWENILSQHGPPAWKAAWRVLGNLADTDDCYQEACVAAFEFSRTQQVRSWRALLQRMATTKAVDRLRQRIRHRPREQPLMTPEIISPDPLPSNQAATSEIVEKLRVALGHIPPRHAEVFCLFHFEGWSYRDIADSLAISQDLVGVWLARARTQLRELLESGTRPLNEVPHE